MKDTEVISAFETWHYNAVKNNSIPMWDSNRDSAKKAWLAAIEWLTDTYPTKTACQEDEEVQVSGIPYKVPRDSIK